MFRFLTLDIIDLFLKSTDEFTGIDFLAELDKDEKMYIDGELSLVLIVQSPQTYVSRAEVLETCQARHLGQSTYS